MYILHLALKIEDQDIERRYRLDNRQSLNCVEYMYVQKVTSPSRPTTILHFLQSTTANSFMDAQLKSSGDPSRRPVVVASRPSNI